MKSSCWLLAVGCWLAPASALAQSDSTVAGRPSTSPAQAPWWIGVWGAAARNSEFDTRLGTRRRDFYMLGIRLGHELAASPRFALDYLIDVVPLLRSTNNPVAYSRPPCGSLGEMPMVCDDLVMETATAHGYGLTPLGFQLRILAGSPVEIVVGATAGVAWYDKPVPDPEEKRLNFMGDLTAGLQMRMGRSNAVLAGIRHNHTSNAGTGRVNPGLDARVLYVGAMRTLGSRAQK